MLLNMVKTIEIQGRRTRYSDAGKGRVVVFLHGFPESLEIWDSLTKELSSTYRVISPDLLGFGGSECSGYVHSMEEMADQVKALLDHLKLRKYAMVGHSMGGYVSVAFAEKYAEHLSGICMFHSSAAADPMEKRADRDRAIEAVKADKKAFVFALLDKLFAPENLPLMKDQIETLRRIAGNTSPQAIIAALEGMKVRANRIPLLETLKVPVFYVVGKKDKVLPAEELIRQSKLPDQGASLLLENAGHMGFYESPDTVRKAIRGFLRNCFQ